jgi:hypothetical protein
MLLEVPDGSRVPALEWWRMGPAVPRAGTWKARCTGGGDPRGRAGGAGVPYRRMVDLARYGMAAKTGALRKLATLLTTVVYLEAKSIDDCLDLVKMLIVTELLGRAGRETVRERARPGARRFSGVPRRPGQEQACPRPGGNKVTAMRREVVQCLRRNRTTSTMITMITMTPTLINMDYSSHYQRVS